jgi:hypothetical protein
MSLPHEQTTGGPAVTTARIFGRGRPRGLKVGKITCYYHPARKISISSLV